MEPADLLVCGSCQRNFPLGNIVNFVQHKKFDCSEQELLRSGTLETLLCQSCPLQFGTPWSLLKHAQNVHALKIYLEQGQTDSSIGVCLNSEDVLWSVGVNGKDPTYKQSAGGGLGTPPNELQSYKVSGSCLSKLNTEDIAILNGSSDSMVNTTTNGRSTILTSVETDKHLSDLDSENINPIQPAVDAEEAGRSAAILEKCCTAVVPKKRKRHMEIKHGGSSGSNARKRTHNMQNAPTSIYIDLEPGAEGQVFKASLSHGENEHRQSKSNADSEWTSTMTSGVRRHSVIIQPGTTFSIPVSYASNMTMSGGPTSFFCSPTSSSQHDQTGTRYREQADVRQNQSFSGVELTVGECARRVGKSAESIRDAMMCDASNNSTVNSEDFQGYDDGQADEQDQDGNQSQHQKRRRYPTSRPFKCDQCNDSFNQRVHLKKHQSKHTGVKPFKCDQCDYSTVERSHLKVHIRVHTGEKPYKCTFCKYATAQNSTLKIHLKRHHLDTSSSSTSSITCSDCGSCFSGQEAFLTHTIVEHGSSSLLPSGGSSSQEESPTKHTSDVHHHHHGYTATVKHCDVSAADSEREFDVMRNARDKPMDALKDSKEATL